MTEPAQVPDPNGPPILPYAHPNLGKRVAKFTLGGVLAAGATVTGLLVVGAATVTPTLGASRSTRITWEKRQAEIAAAQRESDPPTTQPTVTAEPIQ